MGDYITLTLETATGSVKVSMDYSAWSNLLAGDPHKLTAFLAKLEFFAQECSPPLYHLGSAEEIG